jgi:phage/plasmid-associated DNA primase
VKDPKVYDVVMKRLFEDTHDDPLIRKEFLKHLAVAATGKHNARCFVSNIGFSGTGKSTLIKMMKFAYPGYADSIPMSAFNTGHFSKANDHNDSLLKFEHCRWLFTSEQSGTADCELVKKYTGGDPLNPRGCGQKMGKTFYAEATLFTMSNQPLRFDKQDDALMDRMKPFFWKNVFHHPSDPEESKKVQEDLLLLDTVEACEALDHILRDAFVTWQAEGCDVLG